jgi:hypothetical protein
MDNIIERQVLSILTVLYVPGLLNDLNSTSATPEFHTSEIDNTCAQLRLTAVYLSAPAKNGLYCHQSPRLHPRSAIRKLAAPVHY